MPTEASPTAELRALSAFPKYGHTNLVVLIWPAGWLLPPSRGLEGVTQEYLKVILSGFGWEVETVSLHGVILRKHKPSLVLLIPFRQSVKPLFALNCSSSFLLSTSRK